MTFTIIMPVFNAGKYLAPAIESIVRQTDSDFELLLIDDGATDGSSRVCDDYSENDSRIRVFHRQNMGICKSRNFGIENAKGEYILFCDHDDIYFPNYLACVRRTIEKELVDPEIVKVSFCLADRWPDGKEMSTYDGIENLPSRWSKESADYNLFTRLTLAVWDGAYKKDFLLRNGIRFDEALLYGMEDILFMIEALSKVNLLCCRDEVCYKHYSNYGISTSAKYHAERIADIFRVAMRERQLFPASEFRLALARYRRWNGMLYFEGVHSEGAPRNPFFWIGVFNRFQKCALSKPRWNEMKGLPFDERIFVLLLKLRLFWIYLAWRVCKIMRHE